MAYYNASSTSHPLGQQIEEIDLSKSKSYQESQAYYYNKLNGGKIEAKNITTEEHQPPIVNNNGRQDVPARTNSIDNSKSSATGKATQLNPISQFKSNPAKRQAPRMLPKIPDLVHSLSEPATGNSSQQLTTPEVFVKSTISPVKNVSPPKTLPIKQVSTLLEDFGS